MTINKRLILRGALAVLLVSTALLTGLIMTTANGDTWSDANHADVDWYDPIYATYTIDTAEKMAGVAKLVNDGTVNGFEGKILQIDSSLDLSAYLWVPIGDEANPFKGTFITKDGVDYSISGLRLQGDWKYAGLFGYVENGTVGGFTVKAANGASFNVASTSDALYAGSIVGYMKGNSTVFDVTNELELQADGNGNSAFVGGIVGYSEGVEDGEQLSGKLSNVTNRADVTVDGNGTAGGIIGMIAGDLGVNIMTPSNSGAITVNANHSDHAIAGGIIGYAQAEVDLSTDDTVTINSGDITVNDGEHSYAGGIIGRMDTAADFSDFTFNEGAVTIEAQTATESYAGGLIGAAFGTVNSEVSFENSGTVTNNGGSQVHTGGMIGLLQTALTWDYDYTNTVDVHASGALDLYTGGVIGKATEDVTFNAYLKNEGNVTVTGAATEAYTGGLIGYAETYVWLENEDEAAYENAGDIEVTGQESLYTGGIIANRAYSRTNSLPSNVSSRGNITVNGEASLYTGGYIGRIGREALEQNVTGASYAGNIQVTGSNAANHFVATGGIIGFYESSQQDVELSNLSFSGQIEASASNEVTYTGGIVGYAEEVTMTEIHSGAAEGQHASIAAQGVLGGIAGYMNGSLEQAEVEHLTLTANSVGSIAGGVAGQASGAINGAAVGDSAAEGSATVIFSVDIASNPSGADQLTAGGMIGENISALAITDSVVERVTLLTEEGHSQYIFGGIAGTLNEQASIGETGASVNVRNMSIELQAADSQIGGAIGFNEASELYIDTDNIAIAASGDRPVIGGIIGKNAGVLGLETTELYSNEILITASGELVKAGGVAGENIGTLVEAASEKADLTVSSEDGMIGGIVGYNASALVNVTSINASLKANAAGVLAGGVAGYSAPNADTTAEGVHIDNAVVEKSEALPLITATAENSKIGGIVGSALETEINLPVVNGIAPNSVLLLGQAASVMAGGIAGYIEGGAVAGDIETITANADNYTVRNIAFRFNTQAEDSYIGGLAGYADAAAFEAMSVHTEVITLDGVRGTVGGAVGYYHADAEHDATITNMILNTVTLRGMETAENAIIGGMIGVNAAQSTDPATAPAGAISTVKNARIIGNLANPNSPIIDSRASNAMVGGIVGENDSFIANVSLIDLNVISVTGGNSIVGGHTAINREHGVLYNTYANAKLSVAGATTTVGGLIGSNEGKVIGSYVDTPINSGSAGTNLLLAPLGGLVGMNSGDIETSYVQSDVTASGAYAIVGGLVGKQLAGSIENSYAGGKVTASGADSFSGGFAGQIAGGTIQTSYSAMNVKAASVAHAGGFAGRYDHESKELLYKNYYIKDEAIHINKDLPDFAEGNYRWLRVAARLNTVLDETLKDRAQFPGLSEWDFTNTWRYGSVNASYLYPELIRASNGGGSGGEHNVNANVAWYTHDMNAAVYEIRTEAELSGLAAIVNGTVPGVEQFGFDKRIIRIMNPIHIQSNEWIPIGKFEDSPFEGTFDGNGDAVQGEGYLIDGYQMSHGTEATGLFGYVSSSAKIENVNLEPLSLSGAGYVGALAAVNEGMISNVKLHLEDGVNLSGQVVGGLIGKNSGNLSDIRYTSASAVTITATVDEGAAGSLIGINESDINADNAIQHRFVGTVGSTANDVEVGGWIGRQSGDIVGLSFEPDYEIEASGENNIVGGLIGRYVEGSTEGITVELGRKPIVATSSTSIVGGVVGRSEADHLVSDVAVTSIIEEDFVQGNGIVGGVIGAKTGSNGQSWDVRDVSIVDAKLGTPSTDAESTIVGGIIGQLDQAAVKQISFAGVLAPQSKETTVGGLVGVSNDSVIYDVEAEVSVSYEAKEGTSKLGGIAGAVRAANIDASYSLGHAIPLYMGIYLANVENSSLAASSAQKEASAMIGGIAGQLDHASIYFSDAQIEAAATGLLSAKLGGLAGESSGIIVQSTASPSIQGEELTLVWAGGLVGLADAGEIHYSQALRSTSDKLTFTNMQTALPILPEAYIGGFVGAANEVKMSRVYSELGVHAVSQNSEDSIYAGGFAGALGSQYGLDRADLQWAYALGEVSIVGKSVAFAGGFSGTINYYDVSNAYAKGTAAATGHDMRSGGFAGAVERQAVIQHSLALQDTLQVNGVAGTTRAYVGGFAAYNEGTLENVYAHATEMNLAAGANTYKGGLVGYLFSDGNVSDSAYRYEGDAAGYQLGTINNVVQEDRSISINLGDWDLPTDATILLEGANEIVVYNPIQLNTSVLLSNADTALNYYKLFKRDAIARPELDTMLGADLDLSEWSYRPYQAFDLVFDGQGHTITGLTITDLQSDFVGFIQENSGTVQNVRFLEATITAGEQGNAAIVTGRNAAAGEMINVEASGTVTGAAAGSIAGVNEGNITEATASAVIVEGEFAGGITAMNKGSITGSSVDEGEVEAIDTAGGIAATNEGDIVDVFVNASVSGGKLAGGVAGTNEGSIDEAKVQATVTGDEQAGGVTAVNEGSIEHADVQATVSGNAQVGGIAGYNSAGATIAQSSAIGAIHAAGAAGGLAGSNDGSISQSYAGNTVEGTIAGGITGEHAADAVITESFTFGAVTATGEHAKAGGIAGSASGSINDSYAAGIVKAEGTELAYAGGIAGYAQTGEWNAVMSYGEVSASVAGKIVKGKSFAGGLAGQKLAAVSIEAAAYNTNALQADGAYYNEQGVRQTGEATGFGYSTQALTSDQLPFVSNAWQSAEGFFPQLQHFTGTAAAKVSTAAIHLNENVSVHSSVVDFNASYDAELSWTSSQAQFTSDNGLMKGHITGKGITAISVSAEPLMKQLRLNVPALNYEGKMAAPYFVTANESFKDSVLVEIAANDEEAVIYYTLDKSVPTAQALRYTAPIELTATTTIRAIAVADDLSPSDELTGVWRKQGGFDGGGGIFIPIEEEKIPVFLGDKELPLNHGSLTTVPRNSKVSLVVPDDVIVYYTTDGSTPTKDSPIYNGDVLITNNMQLKYITSKDSKVVTLNYTVAPAQFAVKSNAATLSYMKGYSDNTFAPNQAITRQELITGLYELLDIENVPLGTLLKDVPADQAELVAKFESAGLVEGYNDGTFRGDNGLTRAEFVTIVTRILKLDAGNGAASQFTDTEGHWASRYIQAVAAVGHIKGYPDGSFKPDQKITRAEAVVLINRIFGIKAKLSAGNAFSDVTPKHWAYEDIKNAAK